MSALQKATFQRLDPNDLNRVVDELDVQYNPTEFTLNKGAQIADIAIPGLDMPILQFVRGQTETLALDLFFDTTESGMGEGARPVTEETDQFYQLIKIDRTSHAPPVCRFVWGVADFPGSKFTGRWASQNRENGFQCIVESVRQRFTLFSPEGVPLRVTLTLTLREYRTLRQQIEEIRFESSDHTQTHTVQRGETLTRIAGEAYRDPGQWRAIAVHNRITDPLDLRPGTVLEIPPLRQAEGRA
ncbi:MAG: LysM peptidoglycan-binding domain-containing protein [Anaerolineae bacterium]